MNILTNSMERLTKMLLQTDDRLKQMGSEPYRMRKATAKEQREMYESLTSEGIEGMIDKQGIDKVNAWLSKFEKEQYG